jgi:hypothetical protein
VRVFSTGKQGEMLLVFFAAVSPGRFVR